MESEHLNRFAHPSFLVRRKFLKIFGGAFHVYDPEERVVLYSKMKSFRIREDIRLYESEAMTTELLHISTESIFDFSGVYVVRDTQTGETVGALKRHGFKSMARDEWTLLSAEGEEIGKIIEDSLAKALVRRFIELAAVIMPQTYTVTIGDREAAHMKQNFNPFIYKLQIDLRSDADMALDPRLAVCAGVLLAAVEGKED